MDQVRDQETRRASEEAARQKETDEANRAEATRRQEEEEARAAALLEEKRKRLPEEPAVGEPGRVALLFRLPNGQKLQRAFRNSDAVGCLYDFLDAHEGGIGVPK